MFSRNILWTSNGYSTHTKKNIKYKNMYCNVHEEDKGYSLQRALWKMLLYNSIWSKSTLATAQTCRQSACLVSCLVAQSVFLSQGLLQEVTLFKAVLVYNTSLFGMLFHSTFSSSLLSSILAHISTLKCTGIRLNWNLIWVLTQIYHSRQWQGPRVIKSHVENVFQQST